jgi:hypothetical protein
MFLLLYYFGICCHPIRGKGDWEKNCVLNPHEFAAAAISGGGLV